MDKERPMPSQIPAPVGAMPASVSIQQQTVSAFQGPIPPPELLEYYGRIIPDGANRIMKQAELQQGHRMELEKLTVASQLRMGERGQQFGLLISLVALGLSTMLAILGHESTAAAMGGGTVVSLTTIFVLGRYQQRKDLAEKAKAMRP